MDTQLPFPIAFAYHLIFTARDATARYERLLRCYEAIVRFCAAVQLSDYVAAGCPDAVVNRKLLERLPRSVLLGMWVEMVREITFLQKKRRFAAFVPEFAEFYFKPTSGRNLTSHGEIFDVTLCKARNDWGHPDQTWPADEYARRFKEEKPLLDRLLTALSFLSRYKLYVPYRGPRPELVTEAFLLMGPNVPPLLQTDLQLVLTPSVREQLEYELTTLLVSDVNPSQQLPLCPISVFANRDGDEDLFLFESCDLRKETIRRLVYRGTRIGQKPLEIVSGSDRERLVQRFRSILQSLGAVTREEAAPNDDVSTNYFAAQTEIIEKHVRTFVGRQPSVHALERFFASKPRGYFIVRAGPGQGKTALACHLIKQQSLVHHLADRTGGRSDVRLILRSLLAQLAPLVQAKPLIPDTIPELTKRLEDFLAQAVARQKRLVIVLDALDELWSESGAAPPFLVTEGLPKGVYVVATSRPGAALDQLLTDLHDTPYAVHDLGPLQFEETAQLLRAWKTDLTDGEVERFGEASHGNPLYLRALMDEQRTNATFELGSVPPSIEGFYRSSTKHLANPASPLSRDTLGLLTVARKPLSLRELALILGARQRPVFEHGIRPIRQFLLEADDGYCFYHARFHDFVTRELLYEDELAHYHRMLAEWLQAGTDSAYEYRWTALAYHLAGAGNRDALLRTIDQAFLKEKIKRCGYAVLEDVELLARALLATGDPNVVQRCVSMVEGLRTVVGDDVISDTRRLLQGYRPGPAFFRSRVVAPIVASIPGLDVYVGMLPKAEVGADFFEVVPRQDRLVLALGDAPGIGLKSAFVARFIGNAFRRLVEQAPAGEVGAVLTDLNRVLFGHEYFETVSLLALELDPAAGIVTIANAGHPYPILFSPRRGKAERLPVTGGLLNAPFVPGEVPPKYLQRHAEFDAGDVLLLISDGLTESHRFTPDRYGDRFLRIVETGAGRSARAIGEAILDDWRAYPREADYADDVTVMVAVRTA